MALSGQGRVYLAYNDGKYDDNCVGNPGPCGFLSATIPDIYQVQYTPDTSSGRVRRITITLLDDAGQNVSTPDKVVRGLTLVNAATGEEAEIVTAGQPNPEHIFSFEGDRYDLQLDTLGLDDGTWLLSFAVDDVTTTQYVVEVPV